MDGPVNVREVLTDDQAIDDLTDLVEDFTGGVLRVEGIAEASGYEEIVAT